MITGMPTWWCRMIFKKKKEPAIYLRYSNNVIMYIGETQDWRMGRPFRDGDDSKYRDKQLIDEIIYDPQTVGGLAFIISEQNKKESFKILKQYKIQYSVIGYVNNIKNKIKIE